MHPGMCKHSLQYDSRLDGHFGVLVRMWNFGCLSGKGEVCVKLRRRMIDVLLFAGGEMERTGCWG